MNSFTEENYLKAIYKLSLNGVQGVSTNAIADKLATKPSSVTDMIKKLADKKLVSYQKYQGVNLTKKGSDVAVSIIRNHRLWEVFLVEKLNFKWDEVHDLAEELEHINTHKLTERLDEFLGFPKFDPHGDPIPDKDGNIIQHKDVTLSDLIRGEKAVVVGVKEHSKSYLNYLEQLQLVLGAEVEVKDIVEFDATMQILVNNKQVIISNQASKNLIVKKI
ncbi:MAG: metal-dependent transcriptional regulator [Vicingaceae bacterium]|jgi:DtxR family transcriptional regulator, Mn-dependent transcriptional regulator|nr:metal-dependent transcriptional regulator [Flavobacteriales bacterium]MBQ21279.1 iron-dependent repressor [Flavobacteriales bacterium]MDF1676090.1 metal-dependent transcriptional regulator [Vicingaceae bacterium]|tara:strand:- start:131094 stop:131750 length:657 start_codon:yes stop_codon:yes gene_type:complete